MKINPIFSCNITAYISRESKKNENDFDQVEKGFCPIFFGSVDSLVHPVLACCSDFFCLQYTKRVFQLVRNERKSAEIAEHARCCSICMSASGNGNTNQIQCLRFCWATLSNRIILYTMHVCLWMRTQNIYTQYVRVRFIWNEIRQWIAHIPHMNPLHDYTLNSRYIVFGIHKSIL